MVNYAWWFNICKLTSDLNSKFEQRKYVHKWMVFQNMSKLMTELCTCPQGKWNIN